MHSRRDGGTQRSSESNEGYGVKNVSPRFRKAVTAEEVHGEALSTVVELLQLEMAGTYGPEEVANVLMEASARRTSIHQACRDLVDVPSDGNVRYHLHKLKVDKLEERANDLLMARALEVLPSRPLDLGLDLTHVPYHGSPWEDPEELRRGRARSGTTWFHVYATAYVMLYGRRFTLAVRYVRRSDRMGDVVEALLEEVESRGIVVKRLFLDRGFYSVEVISLLQARDTAFVMPVVARGGMKELLRGKTRVEGYTMRSTQGEVSFPVYVVQVYMKGRHGRRGVEHYGFAVHRPGIPLARIMEAYRRRFGIESSYRMMNASRGRTSSRRPKLRLLFVAISLLIQNLWVWLKWVRLCHLRRGPHGRDVLEGLMPYRTLLELLTKAVEDLYGLATTIEVPLGVVPRSSRG